jgi:ketosteroid isomerase-like protein
MSETTTPAGGLVTAFGRPDDMAAMYAPDVTWHLPPGLAQPPIAGIDAVRGFNEMVWTASYSPDCEIEIHDEVGDDHTSAVRFTYRGFSLTTQQHYENQYTVFVRADADGIHEVHEAMDTVFMLDFLLGDQPGASFARFISGQS